MAPVSLTEIPSASPSTTQVSPPLPPPPRNEADLRVPLHVAIEIALKSFYFRGSLRGRELAEHLCLPFRLVEPVLRWLSDAGYCMSAGVPKGETIGTESVLSSVQWNLTASGRERARELLDVNQYAGPMPVSIDVYCAVARQQATLDHRIHEDDVRRALSHLVLAEEVLEDLGPALNGRQAVFLYGAPGNGKTSIAEAVTRLLGPPIVVPRAIYAHGEIIRFFDPIHHEVVDIPDLPAYDRRWMVVQRPEVRVGGELAPHSLELSFDSRMGFYEASSQLKANGGVFFIDDFGRQTRIGAVELLNRLIVPLSKGADYLNLPRVGTTLEVPFTTSLLLATNLSPQSLMDEAFLRRIRFKVHVPEPTESQYRDIWERVCEQNDVEYRGEVIDWLVQNAYRDAGRPLRGVHPRDLMAYLVSAAAYKDRRPVLSRESMEAAIRAYFVQSEVR
jgi:ATPase family associated with various cellular activities (AAA)